MRRRDFLRETGVGAALLALAPAWSASGAPNEPDSGEILARAKERIQKHRKGPGTIVIKDDKGKPIPGVKVRVEQLTHAFLFGSNFFNFARCGSPELEEQYRSRFAAILNYATLGFYWASYEPERGKPKYAYTDQVLGWTPAHGIRCKGHPLVWDHPAGSPRWLPEDGKEIERLSSERVRQIIARFKGRIDFWDVVNEATHISDRLNKTKMANWAAAKGAADYVSEHLKAARNANPAATLLVNDYRTDRKYFDLLQAQHEPGRSLYDVVGIQSHMHDGTWPAARVWGTCERFAKLGLPIHFTETTVVSGPRKGRGENWEPTTPEGESRQGEAVAQFYTCLFSHPAVQAITWWDFSDLHAWQGAAAGWLRRDMSPKPVYERMLSLIRGEWWTKAEAVSDRRGECPISAFYGTHRITAELPNAEKLQKDVALAAGKENKFELTAQ